MNSVKNYFIRQANRRPVNLAHDFLVVGGFLACVYFGFIQ